MRYEWKKEADFWHLLGEGQEILSIAAMPHCEDTFEALGDGAFRWTRASASPVDQMKMTVKSAGQVRYWQVPAVNYNGNGWGSGAQYGGYGLEGEPWTYAWHRVAIPACTYSESEDWAVSLFGEEKGGMSGSIWADADNRACQALLWPEQEGPKVLFKRCWMDPYKGSMAPRTAFTAILFVSKAGEIRESYHDLLDFAWKFFDRDVKMEKSPEEVEKLDTLYFRSLWQRLFDGVTGFQAGMHWVESEAAFVKSKNFELGWVGQNASVSCALMREYLKSGDQDLLDKAISVLDSWMKYGRLENGMMYAKLLCDPNRLDSIINGDIPITLDACNLGVGATYLLKAYHLAEKCGVQRPEYREAGLKLCDFALRVQQESGEFAKSWFLDGTIDSKHGSVGCFFTVPLFVAYEDTGDKKYLEGALKSLDFYYGEFARSGYTTAGALDSYCIDKESAAPLIRAALMAYHATGDQKYVTAAENVAYYLATWQWHYTVDFPKGSMTADLHYDTFGSTSVSAAHNALDHFGLYWVPEYLELAKLTGKDMWRSRARALWYNGTELLSDGTLVVKGRVRPAGSQDESIRHTRWGRPDKKYFTTSEWLTSWQGTYRHVALDMLEDWEALR